MSTVIHHSAKHSHNITNRIYSAPAHHKDSTTEPY
uniref:Uncharacterized protein n=1 Tax=Anguilla anguilla TaxID=7936 RepID=A0A0E9UJF0_ANGAN